MVKFSSSEVYKIEDLVSIIIPCYNQGQFLKEAVNSIFKQTHPNWEIIIINDGSTDNTEEIAQDFLSCYPNIRYLRQSNRSLAYSRNRGISVSSGNFIQLLDADDIIHPKKFSNQLKIFKKRPNIDVVISDFRNYTSHPEINIGRFASPKTRNYTVSHFLKNWEKGFSIVCHSFLFRRRVFQKVRFNENLVNHEDWDCWIQMLNADFKFHFEKEVLAFYRIHENSMSRNMKEMFEGKIDLLKKLFFDKGMVKNKEIISRRIEETVFYGK